MGSTWGKMLSEASQLRESSCSRTSVCAQERGSPKARGGDSRWAESRGKPVRRGQVQGDDGWGGWDERRGQDGGA